MALADPPERPHPAIARRYLVGTSPCASARNAGAARRIDPFQVAHETWAKVKQRDQHSSMGYRARPGRVGPPIFIPRPIAAAPENRTESGPGRLPQQRLREGLPTPGLQLRQPGRMERSTAWLDRWPSRQAGTTIHNIMTSRIAQGMIRGGAVSGGLIGYCGACCIADGWTRRWTSGSITPKVASYRWMVIIKACNIRFAEK